MDVVQSLMFQGLWFEFGHDQEVLFLFLPGSQLGTFHTSSKPSRWLPCSPYQWESEGSTLPTYPTWVGLKSSLN